MNGLGGKKLLIIRGTLQGSKVVFAGVGGSAIEVSFNPTQYTIEKDNVFAESEIPGLGSPIIQFSRGNARVLSLELLLDTYADGKGEDLRAKYIDKLERLIEIDGDLHAPPPCKVLWGNLEFVGVLERVQKNYILFLDDGTPVRAKVTLSFKEYIPVEVQVRQTPFSSPDKLRHQLAKEGDSIWQMAARAYGRPDHWRLIAEANDIDNPRSLEVGKEFIIPPLTQK